MELFYFGLSLALYFILHSILASLKVKDWFAEHLFSQKFYRIFYNVSALALLLPLFVFYGKINAKLLCDLGSFHFAGCVLAIVGSCLLLLALSQYNLAEFSGLEQLSDDRKPGPVVLKTDGFNAYVRHPLYFSMVVIVWGLFVFFLTDLFLVVALVVTVYIYVGSRFEERKLEEEFGEGYKEYKRRVFL